MAVLSNKVYIGSLSSPTYYFENDSVVSIDADFSIDLVGKELPIDILTVTVKYDLTAPFLFKPTNYEAFTTSDGYDMYGHFTENDIREVDYGTPLWFYNNNTLIGKFYIKNIERETKQEVVINCQSAIGLMDRIKHNGGIYQMARFDTILTDIIGASGDLVDYTVNSELAAVTINGWLPYDTKRSNLHKLLLAYNVSLIKNENGQLYFTWIGKTDPANIAKANIYNSGSYDYGTPATEIDVTEHTYHYISSTEEEVIFDNTNDATTASNKLAVFTESPIYVASIRGDGLTFTDATCNTAKVTGLGKLYGIPYTHSTYIHELKASDIGTYEEDNVTSVTDDTLISPTNSNFIANRLLAYYRHRHTLSGDILFQNERCGVYYNLYDKFGDNVNAYLSEVSINTSSNLKAGCKFIENYTPTDQGNIYTNYVILTGSGTWTTPSEILAETTPTFRAILIGGGTGGKGGEDGEDGDEGDNGDLGVGESITIHADGGDGGSGGDGGNGGLIRSIDFGSSGFEIKSSYSYSCGTGGAGGTGGTAGSAGTDTSFGSYTTSTGSHIDTGVVNIFTGISYGYDGSAGIDGGKGANTYDTSGNVVESAESITYNGTTYTGGTKGSDTGWIDPYGYGESYAGYARAGAVGGPAAGANGGASGNGFSECNVLVNPSLERYGDMVVHVRGGTGGKGADAIALADETVYGKGGNGGSGGGGGGQGGDAWNRGGTGGKGDHYVPYNEQGFGGSGGAGGTGAKGGPGCVIIYW